MRKRICMKNSAKKLVSNLILVSSFLRFLMDYSDFDNSEVYYDCYLNDDEDLYYQDLSEEKCDDQSSQNIDIPHPKPKRVSSCPSINIGRNSSAKFKTDQGDIFHKQIIEILGYEPCRDDLTEFAKQIAATSATLPFPSRRCARNKDHFFTFYSKYKKDFLYHLFNIVNPK